MSVISLECSFSTAERIDCKTDSQAGTAEIKGNPGIGVQTLQAVAGPMQYGGTDLLQLAYWLWELHREGNRDINELPSLSKWRVHNGSIKGV